jgi:Xaa-Pro aminopeptidase
VILTTESVGTRLARVRGHTKAAGVDTLVVTHLPNIQYLTGFAGTAGAVVLGPDRCVLLVDSRYVTAAAALTASLGRLIAMETFEHSYDEAIIDVLRRDGSERAGIEAAYLPVSRFHGLAAAGAALVVPTERIVEQSRVIKDGLEIATIREAGRRLARVAAEAPGLVREGRTERDIAWDLEAAMRAEGFSKPAFETIVASGPNSALPHARPTGRKLNRGELTVLDFGGVYDGYCVDLSRTVQLGAPADSQARLFEAVREAQDAAIRTVRPRLRASAIDAAARTVLERHGLGAAFGHGTGHGLGLEVHEEPRISRPSPRIVDPVLEPGMVFTIEPGAYVPGIGGVRIEDDVLVTEDGCEVLTR